MKRIPLSGFHGRGKFALVDDSEYDSLIVFKWHLNVGYAARKSPRNVDGKYICILMHRAIMNPPADMQIDHRDHNKLDNRRCNLRICTRSQNASNAVKQRTLNGRPVSSKFKGVDWHTYSKKWRATITVDGRNVSLGSFVTEIEAAEVYDRAAIEHFGEFANLNFPSELIALTA